MKLPYLGRLSYDLRKSLDKILTQAYPQINFRFVFYNNNTIGNFLKQKDKHCSDLMRPNVVYLFTCQSCTAKYVGSTTRWLYHRILEHKGKSFRTGNYLNKPSFSAIREHSHQHDHQFKTEDFSIISLHSNRLDMLLSESMAIKDLSPQLNSTTTASPLFTQ